jgi:hypothetical protein
VKITPDQPAENPFWFRECFLMPMPIPHHFLITRKIRDYLALMILGESPTERIMEL